MDKKRPAMDTEDHREKKPKIDPEQVKKMIEQKQKEIAAKLNSIKGAQDTQGLTDLQKKILEAKQKMNEKQAQKEASIMLKSAIDKVHDEEIKAKGGLNVQVHPALMMLNQDNKYTNKYMPILPKFSSIKANQKLVKEETIIQKKEYGFEENVLNANPYLDSSSKPIPGMTKRRRELHFNDPGKYINIANEKRTQEHLKKLKEEIAEAARKTGLERELELVSNKAIRDDPPPSIEWWDSKLVSNDSYVAFDVNHSALNELITNLVQHPIPIDPPGEGPCPPPKPLMLTEKERKKLRRQNRLELQREKQDKIRLGLLPQDQPRLTKSNFMRVLGQEAILAPSMVEAEMAKQVKERQEKHQALIESTKLTEQERKEKKDRKLREDTSILVHVAVFKIKNLEHRQHLFKVNQNAQQYKLTGAAIISPGLNLVIVEGGQKGIRHYTKLMTHRIKWDKHDTPQDDPNECIIIWEGTMPSNSFKNFRIKTFKGNLEVKEYLETMKVTHYWNAARTYLTEEY